MNCETLRNRLLGLVDPADVPAPLAAHLDGCSACQGWQQLLVRVEGGIVATAVPARSDKAKRELIDRFLEPAGQSRVLKAAAVRPASARVGRREKLARLWPMGLVAAALLVGVLVWTSLKNKPEGTTVAALPPDPFLEEVVAAKVKLDAAPDATGRLAALDSLEQGLHREALVLSKLTPGADMDSLARMYEKVVADSMVEQARLLKPEEQKALLPKYIDRLHAAAEQARRLAAEAPTGSDRPLLDIEKAALKGRTNLALIMQGQG